MPETKTLTKLVSAVLLALLIFAACSSAAPAVKPKPSITTTPYTAQPEIMNIIGLPEWNPSKEGSLLCAATDPDGLPLNYSWTAEKGAIKGEGNKVTWVPPDATGEYEITVKVWNGQGGEATFSKKFKVVTPAPEAPDKTMYLNLTLPSANTATAKGRLRAFTTGEIQCIVEGRDASELTYTWGSNAGKLVAPGLEAGAASRVGWIAPGQSGNYKVAVIVEDKAGNRALGEVDIEVLCCRDPN